jgi:hypothetical protein
MRDRSDSKMLRTAMRERAAIPGIRQLPLPGLLALAVAVILIWVLPGSAQAASVVGPGGQINGCYKKKGKAKGTLRVVPAGKRCKKGEKRLAWNAQGPQGQTGGQGGTGATGGQGDAGLQSQITDLRNQITQLTSQLAELTGQLNSLCAVVPTLVTQLNSIRTVLNTLSLGGVIPVGLVLDVTGVPAALPSFACS